MSQQPLVGTGVVVPPPPPSNHNNAHIVVAEPEHSPHQRKSLIISQQQRVNDDESDVMTDGASGVVPTSPDDEASLQKERALAYADGLAERRRSLVPMSSMEEENLRERLHVAQLKLCAEIVENEQRYGRDSFRRLFHSKVGI